MKNILFFLATALLHGSTTLSAQTAKKPVSIDLSGRIGSHTKSMKTFAVDKLPGELDHFDAKTLCLQADLNVHKRITLFANYTHERGDAVKTVGRVEPSFLGFFVELLFAAATETFPNGSSLYSNPGMTYDVKMQMSHVQVGGKLNWVAQPAFELYSGLGLGFSGGKATYKDTNGKKTVKNISTAPGASFIPIGMRFGRKVKFDMNVGVGSVPSVSAGIGLSF